MKATDEQIIDAFHETGGKAQAARFLIEQGYEISEKTVRRALQRAPKFETNEFEFIPDDFDIEELIERRVKAHERKKSKHNRLHPVTVKMDGPIGVGFFGDPHIDDDGCDIRTLLDHAALFDGSNEGMVGACLGDIWNNWTGRLGVLWNQQTTDAEEARKLVSHFLQSVNWLFVVLGNHDEWSGQSDLVSAYLKHHSAITRAWRARVGLTFPNGRVCRIYGAHKFPGSSQWIENMGAVKKAKLFHEDHIYVSGDLHRAGYTFGKYPGLEKIWHAVQVGTYKTVDAYGDQICAENSNTYQCPVALIDPYATSELNFIRWEFDPFEAKERLAWMRAQWKKNS